MHSPSWDAQSKMQSDVKLGGVNTAAISPHKHCRLLHALAGTQEHELVSE